MRIVQVLVAIELQRRAQGPLLHFVKDVLDVDEVPVLHLERDVQRRNSSASKGTSNRLELNPAKSHPPATDKLGARFKRGRISHTALEMP